MTAIPIAENINEMSNLTNNNSMNYNTNESIGEENGRQRSSRVNEELRRQDQGRSATNSSDITREEINSRNVEDNISQKAINDTLTNIDAKRKVIEYASVILLY